VAGIYHSKSATQARNHIHGYNNNESICKAQNKVLGCASRGEQVSSCLSVRQKTPQLAMKLRRTVNMQRVPNHCTGDREVVLNVQTENKVR